MAATIGALSSRSFYLSASINWNAPTGSLVDGADEICAEVRTHLAKRETDQFIPMGLTGAPHHLLLQQESKSEIEWALSNQWGTGCNEAGLKPPAFILLSDENGRPPRIHGGPPIAILGILDGNPVLAVADESRHRCLPFIDSLMVDTTSALTGSRSISKLVGKSGRLSPGKKSSAHVALRIVLTGSDDMSHLSFLLDGLEEFCNRGQAEIAVLPEPDTWLPASGPVRPRSRAQASSVSLLAAAAEMRKRRASKVNRRRTLEIVAGGPHQIIAAPESAGHRDFFASMMGDIALAGPSVDALFSGGRFRGFGVAPGIEFPPMTSALLSGTGAGQRKQFEPTTTVSFESDESRGVRMIEHLAESEASGQRSDETRLVSDYSFIGERPLLISTHAFFVAAGGFPKNHELLHLAFPLGRNATFRVRAAYADGWSLDAVLGEANQQTELHGSRFQIFFENGVLAIAFLTRSGLPLVSSIGIHRIPELVLVVGGRFSLSPTHQHDAGAEFAMVWGAGADGVEEIDRLLSGRLPAALQRELVNGPKVMDSGPAASRRRIARKRMTVQEQQVPER